MRSILALMLLAAITAAQPVARWRFDQQGIKGPKVVDQVGDLDGTATGQPQVKRYAAFDGSKHRVIVSKAIDPATLPQEAFTVAAWVRVDAPQPWGGMLSCIEDNGADENGFILGYRGAKFMLGVATKKTGKLTYLSGGPSMREGIWNHVVGTYDGSTMTLWVDGQVATTSNAQSGPIKFKNRHILALAAYHDVNEYYGLTGGLQEVRLEAGAWSSKEVARAFARRPRGLRDAAPGIDPPAPAVAGWPSSMRDARRSGVTPERLKLPLRSAWSHRSDAPASAWPPPAKGSFWQRLKDIKPRNVWDHCHHPIAVGDAVYYGSTTDDRLWCLDAKTGVPRWSFPTEGPIRFAPYAAEDRIYFGSDDGHIYCVRQSDGSEVWRRRLGPSDRVIPGNSRLISPWPVRTGVAVDDGVVYATAGLFPREGCWVAALDASSGKPLWKHRVDQSPQGYLLLSARALYIPTGRGIPFAVARDSGASLGTFSGPAGTYAVVAGNTLISGRGNKGELQVSDTFAKDQLASFSGNRMVVSPEMSFLQSDTHLSALDRGRYLELLPRSRAKRAEHGAATRRYRVVTKALESKEPLKGPKGKPIPRTTLKKEQRALRRSLLTLGKEVDSLDKQLAACVPWKIESRESHALILAGQHLFVGGDGAVSAHDRKTGKKVWTEQISGRALALAVHDGQLIVSTSDGGLYGFASKAAKPTSKPAPVATRDAPPAGLPDRGIVIVLGETPGVSGTAVTTRVLDEQGFLDHREQPRDTTVHRVRGPSSRIADGIANAVVVSSATADLSEARRLAKPWGGRIVVPEGDGSFKTIWTRGQRFKTGNWTHMYADPANTACSDDELVADSLQLQWFGGPGPNPMLDRHLRTTAPLFRDGRLYVPGHDRVIAVDGCNGTVLWERDVKGLSRTGAPYDGGHMAVGPRFLWYADGPHAIACHPDSGEVKFKSPIPKGEATDEWGWLSVRDDGALFGTVRHRDAAIRATGLDVVNRQFAEHQPLVTSHTLFRAGAAQDPAWTWKGGAIVNTSLAVSGDAVYAIAGTKEDAIASAGQRVTLAKVVTQARLVSIDSMTGLEYWSRPFPASRVTHSLFLSATPKYLITIGSFTKEIVSKNDDGTESKRLETWYEVFCFKTEDGELVWQAEHRNNVPRAGGSHGEQVHHPVIRGDLVFTEPVAYHLATGERWSPSGDEKSPWFVSGRRGCGTFSASSSCLYFRNHNPVALKLGSGAQQEKITAVSRPGCWINILPVGGMVLLPEASSGCVCSFPIQTSMGFVPK